MKKNTIVDTANNGQTTTENTVDNTSKLTKAERREQNYVAFRVNALKRRCKRYGLSEEKTNAYVEKLKELLASPNTYDIYVFFPQKDYKMISAIVNKHIDTKANDNIIMEYWMKFVGDNELLNKLREVLPDSAKIQPSCSRGITPNSVFLTIIEGGAEIAAECWRCSAALSDEITTN